MKLPDIEKSNAKIKNKREEKKLNTFSMSLDETKPVQNL